MSVFLFAAPNQIYFPSRKSLSENLELVNQIFSPDFLFWMLFFLNYQGI